VGVLDTDVAQFWLKDHLPGSVLGARPGGGQAVTANQPVIPPDQFFKD
jgi:hypothetical protein